MNQFEMKQRAYQSNLKNRALQVLLYLIDRANKEQTCFPAASTIGRELHISISTVKRAMRELVEAGYVKKESRFREGNRGQTSNLYTLYFPEQEKAQAQNAKEQSKALQIEPEQSERPDEKDSCIIAECTELECKEQNIAYQEGINAIVIVKDRKNQSVILENGQEIHIFFIKGSIRKEFCLMCKSREILNFMTWWTGEGVNLIPP